MKTGCFFTEHVCKSGIEIYNIQVIITKLYKKTFKKLVLCLLHRVCLLTVKWIKIQGKLLYEGDRFW